MGSFFGTVIGAFIALVGVWLSGEVSLKNSMQASYAAEQAACRARVDRTELKVRDSAALFQKARAAIISSPIVTDLTPAERASRIEAVASAGYALSAYSSPNFGAQSVEVADLLISQYRNVIAEKQVLSLTDKYLKKNGEWIENYNLEMSGLADRRQECSRAK